MTDAQAGLEPTNPGTSDGPGPEAGDGTEPISWTLMLAPERKAISCAGGGRSAPNCAKWRKMPRRASGLNDRTGEVQG